jgi:AcrR family transcriptional regulator
MIDEERSIHHNCRMTTQTVPQRPSEARERLLRTASGPFYAKGIHAVGIDELLSRAQVTRATFYRHFPSKDDLIVQYIRTADEGIRDAVAAATATPTSADSGVRALADFMASQIKTPGFRGCAFLNAAAEYPDLENPIHQGILIHRSWLYETVLAAFVRVTDRAPLAAAHFVMRDGAFVEGCLADPDTVTKPFLHGVDGMLALSLPPPFLRTPGQSVRRFTPNSGSIARNWSPCVTGKHCGRPPATPRRRSRSTRPRTMRRTGRRARW